MSKNISNTVRLIVFLLFVVGTNGTTFHATKYATIDTAKRTTKFSAYHASILPAQRATDHATVTTTNVTSVNATKLAALKTTYRTTYDASIVSTVGAAINATKYPADRAAVFSAVDASFVTAQRATDAAAQHAAICKTNEQFSHLYTLLFSDRSTVIKTYTSTWPLSLFCYI